MLENNAFEKIYTSKWCDWNLTQTIINLIVDNVQQINCCELHWKNQLLN